MRLSIVLLAVFLSGPAAAETIFIEATQGNTLYESAEGELSYGAVGRTPALGHPERDVQ